MPETTRTLPDTFFKAIPKVDIHCHLYGTIRKETLKDFARETEAPISEEEIDGYYFRGKKPKGVLHAFRFMEEYILGEAERLHRLTRECLEDLHADNVRYTELFWNSTGTLLHNAKLDFAAAQAAITSAMQAAGEELGIEARLIHAIDRQSSPEDATVMVESMIQHADDLAIGIGIDYLETDHPPEGFWKAYQLARANGYKATAHAGEFGCHWRNIDTALNLLKIDRLDHCYTILDNEALMAECRDRNIVITVVPTNSYYFRTLSPSAWAIRHPIREMAGKGLKIHPNTDDPTFHNVTPAITWKMMHADFGYSVDDLQQFMLNGLDGAWIDDSTRRGWRTSFLQEFEAAKRVSPQACFESSG